MANVHHQVPKWDSPGPMIKLDVLLTRLAEELGRGATKLDNIQHTIGGILSLNSRPVGTATVELQDIDEVQQILQALTVFVRALAQEIPGDVAIDARYATNLITLSALAQRLRNAGLDQKSGTTRDTGDLELF